MLFESLGKGLYLEPFEEEGVELAAKLIGLLAKEESEREDLAADEQLLEGLETVIYKGAENSPLAPEVKKDCMKLAVL